MLFFDLFFVEFAHTTWSGRFAFVEETSVLGVFIDLWLVLEIPEGEEVLTLRALADSFDFQRPFFVLLQFLYVLLCICPITLQSLLLALASNPYVNVIRALNNINRSRIEADVSPTIE